VITGPEDPEAIFCACLLRDFGATVILGATTAAASNSGAGKPYTPTAAQLVRIPHGQDDLDSLND
jgi:hypothetical protein